jgi:membrane protease YdiL (CAAX protease family)
LRKTFVKGEASMDDTTPQAKPHGINLPLTNRTVIIFSVVAGCVFSILFLIITIYFRKQSLSSIFMAGQPLATQLVTGLVVGITIAFPVVLIILKARFFSKLRDFIGKILNQIRPTGFVMLLVALLAGFSEELFFRATLQPMLGLWLTSLLFALAHTGISLSPAKLAFAVYVFAMGVLLGVLYEQSGLVAAIVMHAVYDLIFLFAVKRFLQLRNADFGLRI